MNEYSAQRGRRPLANRYHSLNHRIYREKSKTRNEVPYAEVRIGELHQNTTRCAARRGVDRFTYEDMYWRSKRYCPVLVALEGSALWGNTLATAMLHDQNWTIPSGLIVLVWRFAQG